MVGRWTTFRAPFFIGPAAGRVFRVKVGNAFFARILVHLVAFGRLVRQDVQVAVVKSLLHQLVAQVEQIAVAQAHFFAHAQRRVALDETAQNHDHFRISPMGALKGCPRENFEKSIAIVAFELQNWLPATMMDMVT